MEPFQTMQTPAKRTTVSPGGSDVRLLLELKGGGIAHFALAPGATSNAVAHHTVEEIWYIICGRGEMWRKLGDVEETVVLEPGICLTIPVGTHFQWRSTGTEPIAAIGVTMPPWPGEEEAYRVEGVWKPTRYRSPIGPYP
jgi:mannose-6-phosphate isomerase-like protein (cupin superfamily)